VPLFVLRMHSGLTDLQVLRQPRLAVPPLTHAEYLQTVTLSKITLWDAASSQPKQPSRPKKHQIDER
jgi:hypothetical protein